MKISFHKLLLKKRFPLAISRGVNAESHNVFVGVKENDLIGWGESAPGKSEGAINTEEVILQLQKLIDVNIENKSIYEIERIAREMKISPLCIRRFRYCIMGLKS